MSPSVRGAERLRVVALLMASGVATGGVVGFACGGLWVGAGLPPVGDVPGLVLVGVALMIDRVGPAPLSVRRQVPQAWGRLFDPSTTAVLYGARLGVGPLTILSTWVWWAAALVGASFGPWGGAATGGTFHAARTVSMVLAVAGARPSMASRMAAVRRREKPTRAALALALVVAALLSVTACSDDGSEPFERARGSTTTAAARRTTTTVSPIEEGELQALLLEQTLPGFEPASDDRFDTGPLDLDAAARAELDVAAERSLLQTRRFELGHARAWTDAAGDVVLVTVYEFADPAGASAYLRDGAEHVLARAAPTFEVPEVPDGFGFTQVDESERGAFTGHGVAFVRGSRYVLVVVGSRSSGRTPDEARQVALAQLRRLEEGAVP